MLTKNFYIHLHLIGKIALRQGVYILSASLPTPSIGLRAKALPFSEASNGTPIGEATRTASALPAALPGVLPTSNPCNTNRMKGLFGLSFRSKDRSRRSCDICPTHRFQVGGKTSTKSLWPSGKSFAVCLFGRRPLAYSVVFSDSEESRTKFGATKFSNNKEFIVRLNETFATTSPSAEFLLFSMDSRPTVEDFRCEAPPPAPRPPLAAQGPQHTSRAKFRRFAGSASLSKLFRIFHDVTRFAFVIPLRATTRNPSFESDPRPHRPPRPSSARRPTNRNRNPSASVRSSPGFLLRMRFDDSSFPTVFSLNGRRNNDRNIEIRIEYSSK